MDRAKSARGDLPDEIARIRVAGCKHAYYELADGDFLIVAGDSIRDFQGAVENLDRMESSHATDVLRNDAENARKRLGLRDSLILLIETRPEAAPPNIPHDAALEMSLDDFPPGEPPPPPPPEPLPRTEPEPPPAPLTESPAAETDPNAGASVPDPGQS